MTEQEQEQAPKRIVLSPLQHNEPDLPHSGDTVERSGRTWVIETVADNIVTLHLAGKTNVVKFIPFWAWREMYPAKYEPGKAVGVQP